MQATDSNHNRHGNKPHSAPSTKVTFSGSLFQESDEDNDGDNDVDYGPGLLDSFDSNDDDSDLEFIPKNKTKKAPEKSPPKKKRKVQPAVESQLIEWAKKTDGTEPIDTFAGRKNMKLPRDMQVLARMLDSSALVKSLGGGTTNVIAPKKWATALSSGTTQFMEQFPADKQTAAMLHSMTELDDNFGRLAAVATETALSFAARRKEAKERQALAPTGQTGITLQIGYLYRTSTPKRLKKVALKMEQLMKLAQTVYEVLYPVNRQLAANMYASIMKSTKDFFNLYLELDQRYGDDIQLMALGQCYNAAPRNQQGELPRSTGRAFDQISKMGKADSMTVTGMLRASRRDNVVINAYDSMKLPDAIEQRRRETSRDNRRRGGGQGQGKGGSGNGGGRKDKTKRVNNKTVLCPFRKKKGGCKSASCRKAHNDEEHITKE